MTPLVLLFIGLAVNIKRKQLFKLLSLLFLRAGVVAVLVGTFILLGNISVQNDILALLAFGLSACSFWPFSHIAVVEAQEKEIEKKQRTFSSKFAVNILALSFPLSTILIMAILSSGNLFSNAVPVFILGAVLLLFGCLPFLMKRIRILRKVSERKKTEWIVYRSTQTETS